MAGVAHIGGRLEADRMINRGQGFEMAFYWSPLVFLVVDGLLLVGTLSGLLGVLLSSKLRHRILSLSIGVANGLYLMLLPWRGSLPALF
jgi:hypothetical protein